MSWRWLKSASALPTIWARFPRHGGGKPACGGSKPCRERSRRLAHACSHNEFPASSLQLRFLESDGPAVPPSRHAGRCCGIPGSRTNHQELHRSREIGLPTSRTHKSFRMHSYEKRACKPFGMHCYKIIELKVPWNEYLQKIGGWGVATSRANQAPLRIGLKAPITTFRRRASRSRRLSSLSPPIQLGLRFEF